MNPINKEIANNVFEIFNTKPKVVRYANDDNNKSIDIVICNNSPCDGVSSVGHFLRTVHTCYPFLFSAPAFALV